MPSRLLLRSLLVPLLLLLGSALPASAQDLPLLILRLQAEQGFALENRNAGLNGAVYALGRTVDGRVQSLQVAYNARNRPTLMRLVQKIAQPADGEAMSLAARDIARLGQPNWAEAEAVLAETVTPALTQFAEVGSGGPLSFPLPEGANGAVSFVAAEALAVFDLPTNAPEAVLLSEQAVRALVSDASFLFPLSEGETHSRYHSPNGRMGGGRSAGETTESGSWNVEANGRYCQESAPVPGFRCAALYEVSQDEYLSVPIVNGQPDGRGMRRFTVVFGNPGGHVAPKRDDATPVAVTRMIVGGQTEERRRPEGGVDRIYLSPEGTYRGTVNDTPSSGRWTVLNDGRRCLTDLSGAFECAFLSETDGGTFRLYDAEDTFLGEALYRDGNPDGL